MITVFYDGKCGLCSKEIRYYKEIAPQGVFDWQDITQSSKALEACAVSYADGLRLLHAKDPDGVMHIGVDAFILIWKELRYWKCLAFLVGLPVIRSLSSVIYKAFANWRFKRLPHCQIALDD